MFIGWEILKMLSDAGIKFNVYYEIYTLLKSKIVSCLFVFFLIISTFFFLERSYFKKTDKTISENSSAAFR